MDAINVTEEIIALIQGLWVPAGDLEMEMPRFSPSSVSSHDFRDLGVPFPDKPDAWISEDLNFGVSSRRCHAGPSKNLCERKILGAFPKDIYTQGLFAASDCPCCQSTGPILDLISPETIRKTLEELGTEHLQLRNILAVSESLCRRCYQCAACDLHCPTLRALQKHLVASWQRRGDCSFMYSALRQQPSTSSSVPASSHESSPEKMSGKRGRVEQGSSSGTSHKRSKLEQQNVQVQNNKRFRDHLSLTEQETVLPARKRTKKSKHLRSGFHR